VCHAENLGNSVLHVSIIKVHKLCKVERIKLTKKKCVRFEMLVTWQGINPIVIDL